MEKMFKAALVLTMVCSFLFVATLIYSIAAISKGINENEEEIIYLTEEELEERPLIVEEEPAAVVEEVSIPEEPVEETFRYYEEIPLDKKLQYFTQGLCNEYGVSFGFFLAMCESESSFDSSAVGDSQRSVGYMQINKPNWERYDLDAFMVYDNLEIGIRMLGELIQKYDDIDDVIMAYKAGESAIKSFKEANYRLAVCDVIISRTIYWNQVIDK